MLQKYINNLIVNIHNIEKMPNDWNPTIYWPVHLNVRSYNAAIVRHFNLKCHIKIFTNILAKYIEPHAEQIFGD